MQKYLAHKNAIRIQIRFAFFQFFLTIYIPNLDCTIDKCNVGKIEKYILIKSRKWSITTYIKLDKEQIYCFANLCK